MKTLTPRQIAQAAGLKRYEGLPCKHCGGTTRLVSNQQCIPCRQQRKYADRKKNQQYQSRGRPKKIVQKSDEELRAERRIYEKEYWKRPENIGKLRAKKARRRAVEMQRKPKWLTDEDMWVIKEIYALAAIRTKQFGFVWHVDHIVPLQGENVCGLHVPNNLQVIPAVQNWVKGARF